MAVVQTYRVGVQNRYSAFLEGEEGFALSNSVKRPTNEAANKQKGTAASASSKPAGNRSSGKGDAKKKQDAQTKSSSLTNGQQGQIKGSDARQGQRREGGKAQQPRSQQSVGGPASQQVRNSTYKSRTQGHDGSTANGVARSPRNQMNGQQSDASPQQHLSKENRSFRGTNNPRFNRPRVQNGERKSDQSQPEAQSQLDGPLATNDGEKARHQQRRMNNLRFKDPEKRERRSQAAANGAGEQQARPEQQSEGETPTGDVRGPRGSVRRDGEKNQDFKNKARPRRVNPNGEPNQVANGDRREMRRDRPNQRQRNGFGGGSHSEGGKQDKPKPIPNFSDKSDFPSLAS